ncbi:hypothetical protein [Streptomyces sp. R33]|uniref:Uncharacterized protein n=1 Tax=Streptomyces sp. R33 TaxID=3238629 RepID=A0AB39Y1U8_9ACTN
MPVKTGDRGLEASDDLLTVADLPARDDFDWWGKCGRLCRTPAADSQLSDHRPARRLHDMARQLDDECAHPPPVDAETLTERLEGLADREPDGHGACDWDGSWLRRQAGEAAPDRVRTSARC